MFVFVKKEYAISVHNDNLSFTKTKQCITRKFAKTFVQQKSLNAEKVYDCLGDRQIKFFSFFRQIINDAYL